MTDNPSGLPPAGWYPDPYGAPYERWWDGAQWTEHTTTPAPSEPVQPIYQAPVEPVQPVQPEQPLFEQPVYEQPEQPSYQQPSWEQPATELPSTEQPSYTPGGFGEQFSNDEPAYEEPEYEQTYEATQQQPSPSWASPVSAAGSTPASFDDLFGSKPQPTDQAPDEKPFSFSEQNLPAAEPARPVTAEPAFDSLFGASTRTGQPSYEQPAYEQPSYEQPQTEQPQDAWPPAEQPATDFFGGSAASSQSTGQQTAEQQFTGQQSYAQQSYAQPAGNDDFGMLLTGGAAASAQPGATAGSGETDTFSSWSNEEYVDPPRNSAATASVAFGVLSFVIPGVAGLVGLVLGALGVLRANRFAADGDGPIGRTKAFVGIGLSVIGTIVSIALVLFVLPGIINPTADGAAAGNSTEGGSSIVAAAPSTANGGISLADGDLATITFPDTDDPSIQFSVTGITVNPTCTEDPELVLTPENGQFIAVTMTVTTAADYAGQLSTGGLLMVSPRDFSGYLPDGTSVLSSDAGNSCVPEAEQLPDSIPAGETVTGTVILDLSEAATSITYAPVGVTDLDPFSTFWEWAIPR